MVRKSESESPNVSDSDFREAVRKLLNTPPQHKPAKKSVSSRGKAKAQKPK